MVSPVIWAPPVPLAPLVLKRLSVTVGAILSTVALVVSATVDGPLPLVAVMLTFKLVVSMEPETRV